MGAEECPRIESSVEIASLVGRNVRLPLLDESHE